MNVIVGIIVTLVQNIIFGCAASTIAEEKGRSSAGYFWLGFLLGATGMAITLTLEKRHVQPFSYKEYLEEQNSYERTEDYINKLSK